MQLSVYTSSVSVDSLNGNIHSPRNSMSDWGEPPSKPPAFSSADIEAHDFDKLHISHRRSLSWSSTTSDNRPFTGATSSEPFPSRLSGRRHTTNLNRTDSNISLTPSDATRYRGGRISQTPPLSDSPRGSADHNLLKLATKNRSRVSLQSRSQSTPARWSMGEDTTGSVSDALVDTNAAPIPAAAAFALAQRPRPPPQQLGVPHSGNTRMPAPVPEETQGLATAEMALLSADDGASGREVTNPHISRRSTPRQGSLGRQEVRYTNQRGIRGFGSFVKRSIKKLPSRLQNRVVGLIRMQRALWWERGQPDGKGKGKEPEVILPSSDHNQEKKAPETTGAPTDEAASPLLNSGAFSPAMTPAQSPSSMPTEPAMRSSHIPGPAEVFPEAAGGQELDRQQVDVNSTQQISDAVRNAMSEAWAQPESPVIVAMCVPTQSSSG